MEQQGARQEREQGHELLSLKVAAKGLGVHVKTVQRYVKRGLLTPVRTGSGTYVAMDDVRRLRQAGREREQGQKVERLSSVPKTGSTGSTEAGAPAPNIPDDFWQRYEALLVRLGYLEERDRERDKREQLLLEYERQKDSLALELEQAQEQLSQMREESKSVLAAQAMVLKETQAAADRAHRRGERLAFAVWCLLAILALGTLAVGLKVWMG